MKDEGLFVGYYLDKSLASVLSEHYSGEVKGSLLLMWTALPSPEQMYDVFMMLNKAQTLTVIFVTLYLY